MKLSREEIWAQAPRISLTVEAVHPVAYLPDGGRAGLAVFNVFVTDVKDEDDNVVGSIGGGIGAVTLTYEGKTWQIRHDDLWHAFMEALG